MAKWRYFAERELPRVIRALGLPAARPPRDHPLTVCPLHKEPLGAVTRMCEPCHRGAWDEIGRRYAAQGRPILTTQPEPKDDSTMTTTIEDEPLEGELVTTTPGTELVPHAGTLFGTSDPRVALERMADIATALVDVIDTKKLYATIAGRKHITVEGWTTLGGMLGVVPIVTGTRANDTGDGIVATVEARTLDGRVVGAAEGECSRAESKWKSRDPYAIRSTAQTRAISRALRAPLGQIIALAGYEATPAEEIPRPPPPRQPS